MMLSDANYSRRALLELEPRAIIIDNRGFEPCDDDEEDDED